MNILELWDYFLFLEKDLETATRYVQPRGQEDVHSYEFVKIIILACIEIESLLRTICGYLGVEIDDKSNIVVFRNIMMERYPNIVKAEVYDKKLRRTLTPFDKWADGKSLKWWKAYNNIKHNRTVNYGVATYINASTALAAEYILLLYLAEMTGELLPLYSGAIFDSKYNYSVAVWGQLESLPDFPNKGLKSDALYKYITDDFLDENGKSKVK